MALIYADRVLETSVTTGTGPLTLAAAVTGFQRFSAAMSTDDTCYYAIFAVDVNGNPSGDWEAGYGTYSSANTLTRTAVHASTNSNNAVDFAAGTKYVILTPTAYAMNRVIGGYNVQTASYTLVMADAGKLVAINNAGSNDLTIPPNSSVAFPLNTRIDLAQYGAGQTTIVAGAGVTIRSSGSKLKLSVQYSGATVQKIGTDEWWAFGDLSA
jgi:hypothetical protein